MGSEVLGSGTHVEKEMENTSIGRALAAASAMLIRTEQGTGMDLSTFMNLSSAGTLAIAENVKLTQ